MDGWEDMALPRTAASYYMQRGVSVSGSGTQLDSSLPISAHHGVNASAGLSQGEPIASAGLSQGEPDASAGLSQEEPVRKKRGRPRKNGPDGRRKRGRPRKREPDGQNMPVQSNLGGNSAGSTFQLDSSSPISAHGVNASAGLSLGEPVRRQRGRPRKKGPDGTVLLGLSSVSSPPPPSLGEWLSGSAGMGLTPHIITIAVGEDIAEKIMSFSQQGPRAVCILSANGVVSTVTLRRPSTSSGTVKYEGRYEILWLSGSYMLTDNDGSSSRTGGLSVSLCSHDGQVICGGVGEMLVAATPVQVILVSFMYSGSKTKNTVVTISESSVDSGDNSVTPTDSIW